MEQMRPRLNNDPDDSVFDITDSGGYLPCGCHGSQADHTCQSETFDTDWEDA